MLGVFIDDCYELCEGKTVYLKPEFLWSITFFLLYHGKTREHDVASIL